MTTSSDQPLGEPQGLPVRRLHTGAVAALAVWLVVSIVLTVMFMSQPAGDWEDLVRVIALVFMAVAIVILAVTALLIRWLIRPPAGQVAAAVLGPPAVVAILIFAVPLFD